MKKGFLFLLTISVITFSAEAQSLKDLLYSGKLKKDSNTVIRKGDDLSSRIDTGTKKPAEAEVAKVTPAMPATSADSTIAVKENEPAAPSPAGAVVAETAEVAANPEVKESVAPVKNNNQLLKAYSDSLITTLKTEVLTNKKMKKGTYYLTVDYEIGADSQVTVLNVVSTPENAFLQEQVKERMLITPPQLNPALDSAGKARKVKRKYNFNVTKE